MEFISKYLKIFLNKYQNLGILEQDTLVQKRRVRTANYFFHISILAVLILMISDYIENKFWVFPTHYLRIVVLFMSIFLLSKRYYLASIRLGVYSVFIATVLGTYIAPVQNSFHLLSFPLCALSLYFIGRRFENIVFIFVNAFYFVGAQYYNSYFLPEDNSSTYIISVLIIFLLFYISTALFVAEFRFFEKIITRNNEELQEQNQSLESKNNELSNLNVFKNKMISIISHDLKNPFNGLYGISTLVKKNFRKYTTEKNELMIQHIHNNAEVINYLLNDLLLWAGNHTYNIEIKKKYFDLVGLCKEVRDVHESLFCQKDISVDIIPENEQIYVNTDPVIVTIVIRNFLNNAIKYSSVGGKIVIAIQVHEKIQISVLDKGIGLDSELLKRIELHDTNISTPGTNAETGHGLGLILCADLAKLIDGVVYLENNDDGVGAIASLVIEKID